MNLHSVSQLNIVPEEETPLLDAIKMLDALQEQAQILSNEKDDASIPNFGTSKKNNEKYDRTHYLVYDPSISGIKKECFYAASTLLEQIINSFSNDQSNRLSLSVTENLDRFVIFAKNNVRAGFFEDKNLMAPVTLVPFDKIRKSIDNLLELCFSHWEDSGKGNNLVEKKCRTFDDSLELSSALHVAESVCKEIDNKFNWKINLDDTPDRNGNYHISINKSSNDLAKALIGYSELLRFRLNSGATPLRTNNEVKQVVSSSLDFKSFDIDLDEKQSELLKSYFFLIQRVKNELVGDTYIGGSITDADTENFDKIKKRVGLLTHPDKTIELKLEDNEVGKKIFGDLFNSLTFMKTYFSKGYYQGDFLNTSDDQAAKVHARNDFIKAVQDIEDLIVQQPHLHKQPKT